MTLEVQCVGHSPKEKKKEIPAHFFSPSPPHTFPRHRRHSLLISFRHFLYHRRYWFSPLLCILCVFWVCVLASSVTVFILFFAGFFSQFRKPYYEIYEALHHPQHSQFLTRLQIPLIQNCHCAA